MRENSDKSNPKFQYSVGTLLLVTALVAILFSSYRIGSTGVFTATVVFSGLVASIFVIVTRRNLGWYSLFVLGAVMVGGTIAVEGATHNIDGIWYCVRDKRDGFMPIDGFAFFGGAAIEGGFLGGIVSTFIATILVEWRRNRNNRSSDMVGHSARDNDADS